MATAAERASLPNEYEVAVAIGKHHCRLLALE